MFARTDRLPAWITAPRARRRLSRRGPARSAGNRGAAAAGRIATSPPAAGIRCSTCRSKGSATRSWRSLVVRGHHPRTARPCLRRRRQSQVGPRSLFQRHPAAGGADRRQRGGATSFAVIDERAAASPARSNRTSHRPWLRARFRSCSSIPRWWPSIRPRISRSARGRSPPARPAIRRSCWPRAARGEASSSSARVSRCSRSASSLPPARPAQAPPSRRSAPISSPRSRTS